MIKAGVKGEGKLAKTIKELIRKQADSKSIFQVIGGRMRDMQVKHFVSQTDSSGGKWKKLSPATLSARAGKAKALGMTFTGKVQILRDTGRLYTSINSPSSTKTTANEAVVGTNVAYAKVQQFGSKDKKIPARQFLYLNAREKKVLVNFLEDSMVAAVFRKAGVNT